jgi:hypothetical protein
MQEVEWILQSMHDRMIVSTIGFILSWGRFPDALDWFSIGLVPWSEAIKRKPGSVLQRCKRGAPSVSSSPNQAKTETLSPSKDIPRVPWFCGTEFEISVTQTHT